MEQQMIGRRVRYRQESLKGKLGHEKEGIVIKEKSCVLRNVKSGKESPGKKFKIRTDEGKTFWTTGMKA